MLTPTTELAAELPVTSTAAVAASGHASTVPYPRQISAFDGSSRHLRGKRSEKVPPVTGDVEEDRDTAVRLGARFTNERDPSSRHPSVRRVEVVDTEKEPDPAGCLVADGCHLAFSVCTSEEKTRLRSGRGGRPPTAWAGRRW